MSDNYNQKPDSLSTQTQKKENDIALISLILGIVGIAGVGFPVTSILAIVFGVRQNRVEKNTMATAAIVLGIVALALVVVSVIMVVINYAAIIAFFGLIYG